MFNILDLFCGTGAISYGLQSHDSRYRVVGGVDIDNDACETARANHPIGTFLCTPIDSLSPRRFCDVSGIAEVDMIVGGPPCQGFSSLRPNRASSLDDPRNRLYKSFISYVRYCEPTVFLMENVVGLLTHSQGRLFRSILTQFRSLGYELDWRVLNAANFGVPQKRERVLIVGVNTSLVRKPRISFPEPTHSFEGRVVGTRVKDNYIVSPKRGRRAVSVHEAISDLPPVLSGEAGEVYATPPQNDYQRHRRRNAGRVVTLHRAANHSQKMLKVMRHAGGSRSALPAGLVTSGFSSCYSRMERDAPATTITVKFTSPASSKCIHPTQDRAITPREAARLQSFDDSFVFCGSKTSVASQIGNAVPPLLGKAMAPTFTGHLEVARRAR